MSLYINVNKTDVIKTNTFTSTIAGTTIVAHGLIFNPEYDEMKVFDLPSGNLLEYGVNYRLYTYPEILLLGRTLNVGEQLRFQVIKNIR